MPESAQSPVITKVSKRSVAETVDRLKRVITDRGFKGRHSGGPTGAVDAARRTLARWSCRGDGLP
jgi:hypothetical protein